MMTDASPFRSLCALLHEKRTGLPGVENSIVFLGKQHVFHTNSNRWREKEASSCLITLYEHLPRTLKNLTLANTVKTLPNARELEILSFIGFRLLGNKLFQLSLLRAWTDGLGERNKQLMVYALGLIRKNTRPPPKQMKMEFLAAKPSEQAAQVIATVIAEESRGQSQPSPLKDITQYIEEYHGL